MILRVCMNLIRIFAVLSAPVMPETAEKMMQKFGLKIKDVNLNGFDVKKEICALKAGDKFEVGDMLFERITPERAEELKQKYGSTK